MKILVIVPAFNEQDSIRRVLADLAAQCPRADVLAVNDGSSDRTERILEETGTPHLRLAVNLGIGGSMQAGYRYARDNGYEIAVQFDGDGQHRAEYLEPLLRPVEAGEADLAVGSRFLDQEGYRSGRARRTGIFLLSRLIRLLSGVRVTDATSGMRAVNRRFICEYAERYAQDYPEPEAILYAGLRGARITEVPVRMRERQSGRSSIGAARSVYYMIKVSLALVIGRMGFRRRRPEGQQRTE